MLTESAALAVGAGMLAALNPCGFALLPAYLTLLVVGDDQAPRAVALGRALRMTATMTAGFASLFAVFGLVVAPLASSVQRYLPWVSVAVGLALLAAGGWVLSGRTLWTPRVSRGKAPVTGSLGAMFGYGVSYAAASLTCTIAPFLAVVVAAFRSESWIAGGALFLLYAAGMGLVVGTAAVAVALAQGSLVRGARRLGQFVPTAGGVLLVVVGGYVAYYGWWEIRVLRGGPTDDVVIQAAAAVQQRLAAAVSGLGVTGFLVVLAVLALITLGATAAQRSRSRGAKGSDRPV